MRARVTPHDLQYGQLGMLPPMFCESGHFSNTFGHIGRDISQCSIRNLVSACLDHQSRVFGIYDRALDPGIY